MERRSYLRDMQFWIAVGVVNLVSAPFVGIGRALYDAWASGR